MVAFLAFILVIPVNAFEKATWPREITTPKGVKITVYQPEPESVSGNKLDARMVVSVKMDKTSEPVFGVVWTETTILTDKESRIATMEGFRVTDSKFPDAKDQTKVVALKTILETEIPKWKLDINLDEIVATLEEAQPQGTDAMNTKAPEILFRYEPTTLILIDGEPKVKMDDELKMERVINTPFFIVKNPDDKKYYLYAGSFWYVSSSVTNGWTVAKSLTKTITSLDTQIKKKESEDNLKETGATASSGSATSKTPAASPTTIIVSTTPAELIQTTGEANFVSVQGTGLLYIKNTEDNIFKCIEDQQYYILLSGRWYKAAELKGPWNYIAADKLPADFAKIPEGSEKDVVLPFVAGTDAAREAVMDAQIPQTAKVDRNSTECTVTYDGEPKFEPIEGTGMKVAMNTSSTVLLANNRYYAVENGVWFVSNRPDGPWKVSDERPADVDKIPPESQAYNTKYVYIYETTPEYVYVGYTPGYMGSYVYGPTVIYGTGYYYNPWYGPYYYPRPVTYGFSMHYNPWYGWGMSMGYSTGFFRVSIGFGGYGRYGGYWGCPGYHPPYHGGHGGHYGNNYTHNDININTGRNNNVYNNRRDVQTRDVSRGQVSNNNRGGISSSSRPSTGTGVSTRPSTGGGVSTRPTTGAGVSTRPSTGTGNSTRPSTGAGTSTRPSTGAGTPTRDVSSPTPSTRGSNNMYSDKSGNVYKQDSKGGVQQRSNNSWQSTSGNKASTSQVNKSSQQRDRGNMRSTNAASSRPSSSSFGGRAAGGGARTGGGGRR